MAIFGTTTLPPAASTFAIVSSTEPTSIVTTVFWPSTNSGAPWSAPSIPSPSPVEASQ